MILRNGYEERKRLFSAGDVLVLLVLFLSFMDFYLYSLHLMVIAFALFFIIKGRITVTNSIFPMIFFTAVLWVFWTTELYSPTAIMKRIVWPAAFLLGYNFLRPRIMDEHALQKMEKRMNVCLIVATVGFFAHLVLNMYTNIGNEDVGRNTIDFWSGEPRAATGQAGLMCVPMAWSIASFFNQKKLTKKMPAVLIICVMMYYNLTLGTRAIVIECALCICVAMLFILGTGENSKKKVQTCIGGIALIVVFLMVYTADLGGIRTMVEESILGSRMFNSELREDDRWENKFRFIENLINYPWGGNHILQLVGSYAHDILLDTYDETSLFGFLAVVAILYDSIAKLFSFLRCAEYSRQCKMMIVCLYTTILLEFAVEPIFAGMPWMLAFYCFVHGMVTCLVKNASVSTNTANL